MQEEVIAHHCPLWEATKLAGILQQAKKSHGRKE